MLKNILSTFFVRVFSSAVSFAVAILISNYLGADGKGEQGLILSTISLLIVIISVIGAGALSYLIPRMKIASLIIPSWLWLSTVSVLSYSILHVFPIVSSRYNTDICLLSGIFNIGSINSSILVAKEKIWSANKITVLQLCFYIASLAVLLQFDKSTTAYINSLYISYSISVIYSFVPTRIYYRQLKWITWQELKNGTLQLFRYGCYNQIDVFAQMLSFRYSYYILSNQTGNKAVGVYSVAVSIVEILWLISRSFSMVQYARIANSTDEQYSQSLVIDMIKISTILVAIASFVLAIIPGSIYSIIFGTEFDLVQQVLFTLLPGVLIFNTSFMISGYFSGTGRHHINSIASIIGLAFTAMGAYLLIPRYGIIGAGLTASIAYTATSVTKIVIFSYSTKIDSSRLLISKIDLSRMKKYLTDNVKMRSARQNYMN